MHVSQRLLHMGYKVVGLDNLNNYYDIKLKKYRVSILEKSKKFYFIKADIKNKTKLNQLFKLYIGAFLFLDCS